MNKKREDNRFRFTDDMIFDKVTNRIYPRKQRFIITDKEWISYTGGYAYTVSSGEIEFSLWEDEEDAQKVCDYLNDYKEEWDNEKNDYMELFSNYICLQEKNIKLIKENEQLRKVMNQLDKENKKLQEEIEELKRERDSWKSSTCSYMNKDSVLSMDCQVVQEALWELEKEIEFGSKREDLFFDLKEKFEKLNNHRIGVF